MKTIKIIIGLILLISLSACQKSCQQINKQCQSTERYYHIEQYSGGILIKVYEFQGILNDSEGSDGYYFYDAQNRLIEISGDLFIISTKDKYKVYEGKYNPEP